MIERDSGSGRLLSLGAGANEYMVDYVLLITTDVTGESERFSPPRVIAQYSLSVDEKGQSIPSGEYTLKSMLLDLSVSGAENVARIAPQLSPYEPDPKKPKNWRPMRQS